MKFLFKFYTLKKILEFKLAERVAELRKEKNMTRKELADKMFVSVRLISYWETGKRECDFDTLVKLSNLFNESVDYILGKTDN